VYWNARESEMVRLEHADAGKSWSNGWSFQFSSLLRETPASQRPSSVSRSSDVFCRPKVAGAEASPHLASGWLRDGVLVVHVGQWVDEHVEGDDSSVDLVVLYLDDANGNSMDTF
jgi:hypothetical protein